jgi:hypothetical protein
MQRRTGRPARRAFIAARRARLPEHPVPARRTLRGYAFDPQLSTELDSAAVNEILYDVRWEHDLAPGPCGDYLDVIDFDPASDGFYPPVDLNEPALLAQDGLAPSEANPQFHQQMVYAVAMTTIERFEHALGRRVLWSPRAGVKDGAGYVGRLRVYPHALRERNAYYDPARKALLFGYFPAADYDPGRVYPRGMVFTCLSQDIVAHETTHAILDGVHPALLHASNVDSLAFHEAFADLVALFQHFSMPAALAQQIAKARGDLRTRNLLAELAVQFGEATGRYGSLRSAIGTVDRATGAWTPLQPDPLALERVREPHDRGAILVAAVFDAFLRIYERRTADLLRIATGGSGVLPAGALHPDLVARLADEAAKSAAQVLTICIRALDYCPPVDLTFGDYLRALITADHATVPDDRYGYRIAFVAAFRARGIYPRGLRALSVDSLLWGRPGPAVQKILEPRLVELQRPYNQYIYLDSPKAQDPRREIFVRQQEWRRALQAEITAFLGTLPEPKRRALGLEMGLDLRDGHPRFAVRSLQFTRKATSDSTGVPRALVSIVQERAVARQGDDDRGFTFRGGCTIVVDLRSCEVDFVVSKNVLSAMRLEQERAFQLEARCGLVGLYLGEANAADPSRTLALLHGFAGEAIDG